MNNDPVFTKDVRRDLDEFLKTINNVSDHSCAILAGAKIDSQLRDAIESRILSRRPNNNKKDDPLLKPEGPLGTFSSRIEIAYRLGLITYQHANALDQLRRIRNDFAHGTENSSFSKSPAKDRIHELVKYWNGPYFNPYCDKLISQGNSKERAELLIFYNLICTSS